LIGWLWRWGPVVAQMAVIFVASSLPNLGPLPGGMTDKTGHLAGYAALAALTLRALAGAQWRGCTSRAAWRAWILSAAYGATDEFHQSFVPGRSTSFGDWVADVAGAGLAVLVLAGIARTRRPTQFPREV
jgi:VanZ family protein